MLKKLKKIKRILFPSMGDMLQDKIDKEAKEIGCKINAVIVTRNAAAYNLYEIRHVSNVVLEWEILKEIKELDAEVRALRSRLVFIAGRRD